MISVILFKMSKHSDFHLIFFQIEGALQDFTVVTKLIKKFESLYGFKSIILGQMSNLNVIFHVVVSVYRLVKIWNSPQSPDKFRNCQLIHVSMDQILPILCRLYFSQVIFRGVVFWKPFYCDAGGVGILIKDYYSLATACVNNYSLRLQNKLHSVSLSKTIENLFIILILSCLIVTLENFPSLNSRETYSLSAL